MAKRFKFNTKIVNEIIKQLSLGVGIGAFSDFLVEFFQVPVLNTVGTFGNTQISNFEIFGYGVGLLGTVSGVADVGIGKGVLTFSRRNIFIFVGLILGIYFYEHTFADLLQIRKVNIYEQIQNAIPQVLPSNVPLPLIQK